MSDLVKIAISSSFIDVLADGTASLETLEISPESRAVIEYVNSLFSTVEGTPLTEQETSDFPYGRKLFTGKESKDAHWRSVELQTNEDASDDLWAAAADLAAVNGHGSDLLEALRDLALAFKAEPETVVLSVAYEKPGPLFAK